MPPQRSCLPLVPERRNIASSRSHRQLSTWHAVAIGVVLLLSLAFVPVRSARAQYQTPGTGYPAGTPTLPDSDSTAKKKSPASAHQLPGVTISDKNAGKPTTPVAPLPDVQGTLIFAGKKTEVITIDSVMANTAQNVTRELYGRVPGLNISETENSGFPSNGIGFRGLNPIQSVEMNTRQDGVNIVADLYGYPETYYTPAAEALDHVEFIRGSSGLQFGPQFGGVVNYVLRDGTPNTPPTFTFNETGGSNGLFDSYSSLAGGTGKWTYFAYGQYRHLQGWRANGDLSQFSGDGHATYQASDRLRLTFGYSLLRNRIHMPGGLDDAEFDADPRASFRSRNWIATPWNILSSSAEFKLSPTTKITSTFSYMFSQRYLVWRNEDGGAGVLDTIDPATNSYIPREVEREAFNNLTNETRLVTSYSLFGNMHTLATGFRLYAGTMGRQEGGPGTTGTGFDMSLTGPYETDVHFTSDNAAAYAENIFRIGSRFSITPGVRVEYLRSTVAGHTDTLVTPAASDRSFLLGGVGAQYKTSTTTELYANITQAYRPIEYSFLYPLGSTSRVDPNLKDPTGYNADLAWRGSASKFLNFDVGVFYLSYHNRIGQISAIDSTGAVYTEETNVANSVHKGVEAYAEAHPLALLGMPASLGTVGVFDDIGYTDARYVNGQFAGNFVEDAPEVINRVGVKYELGRFAANFQASYTSKQFTDANNTVASSDANVGIVPAYQLLDMSGRYRLNDRTSISGGINNLANIRYFTMRTTEYPGPGIIPGIGRTMYFSLSTGL